MMKIGLTGVHGSGKSVLANKLQKKYVDTGKKVYMVHGVARNCPYTLGTVEAQEYIWNHQMRQERHAMAQDVDVIICDRTVMDNLMYYHTILDDLVIGFDSESILELFQRWDLLHSLAIRWMPTYTQVIRLPLNLEWLQAEDIVRPKSPEYAKRIDKLFDRFVDRYVTHHGTDSFP